MHDEQGQSNEPRSCKKSFFSLRNVFKFLNFWHQFSLRRLRGAWRYTVRSRATVMLYKSIHIPPPILQPLRRKQTSKFQTFCNSEEILQLRKGFEKKNFFAKKNLFLIWFDCPSLYNNRKLLTKVIVKPKRSDKLSWSKDQSSTSCQSWAYAERLITLCPHLFFDFSFLKFLGTVEFLIIHSMSSSRHESERTCSAKKRVLVWKWPFES